MGEKNKPEASFSRSNPGVEHLDGMIIEYRGAVEQFRLHHKGDDERQALLDLCEHNWKRQSGHYSSTAGSEKAERIWNAIAKVFRPTISAALTGTIP
jgi:hypothetical protein